MKKLKILAIPFCLPFLLGACSGDEEVEADEDNTAAETVSTSTADLPETDLELPGADEVAVIVNGEEIKGIIYNSVARQLESSLAARGEETSEPDIKEQVKEKAISIIVDNKLIIQDALAKGHAADEKELEQRLDELKNQFENEEQMNIALERIGFTLEDMEYHFREQLIYASYVDKEIESAEVTEEEIEESYQDHVDSVEGESPEFKEMKPMILKSLEERNMQQAVLERIEELRNTAEIEVKI